MYRPRSYFATFTSPIAIVDYDMCYVTDMNPASW
jgi:hypothetical protein